MSQLVDCLVVSHVAHDIFVRMYVERIDEEDCVEVVLRTRLQSEPTSTEEPNLYSFVAEKMKEISSTTDMVMKRIQHLTLYILLTQYPEQWNVMFEAAYELLVGLLDIICNMNVTASNRFPTIYPPMWTQKIFRLENYLAPGDLKGIIFGIDPIPGGCNPSNAATGYAFTFDRQPGLIKFEPQSTKGLLEAYCLKNAEKYASENGSQQLENDDFMKTHGIGMVNFIRTIRQVSYTWSNTATGTGIITKPTSGSLNVFKEPWIRYNLAWLKYVHESWWGGRQIGDLSAGTTNATNSSGPCISKNRVLIFQNERYIFNDYSDSTEFEIIKDLLKHAPRCSHPSYIRAAGDHCVLAPSTYYGTPGYKPDRCNASVKAFRECLKERGALGALCCHCPNKSNEQHRTFFAQAMPPTDSESGDASDDLDLTANTTTLSISDVSSSADASTAEQHLTTTATDEEANEVSFIAGQCATDLSSEDVDFDKSFDGPYPTDTSTDTSTDEVSNAESFLANPQHSRDASTTVDHSQDQDEETTQKVMFCLMHYEREPTSVVTKVQS